MRSTSEAQYQYKRTNGNIQYKQGHLSTFGLDQEGLNNMIAIMYYYPTRPTSEASCPLISKSSKWSYAFLDLGSIECTCAQKSTYFVSRIIWCDNNFPAITPFSVGCFSEARAGLIKSKLPYMASTCCCDLLWQLNWPIPLQLQTTWYFNQ